MAEPYLPPAGGQAEDEWPYVVNLSCNHVTLPSRIQALETELQAAGYEVFIYANGPEDSTTFDFADRGRLRDDAG